MATTVARLQAVLSADTRDFDRGMDKSHSKLGSFAKGAAVAAGAAGIGGLFYTIKTGIKEFNEHQKVTAQTTAVLKSMGHGAGVTAKQVEDLANSIMRKTGIDDESIQSGENLLLTFRNIRNEAGKGNDIFTQATHIMTDFSVTFGKSVPQSAILVGKALNDPIKGLTALGRVGVQFTEQQKEQIKSFIKNGETMKAQKIIMAELTAETKGAAEAQGKTLSGQINIARETFNNFAGDLVAKTIPVLERAIGWLRDHWPEITARIREFWSAVKPTLEAFGAIIAEIGGLVVKHWGTIGPIVEKLAHIVETQMKIVAAPLRIIAALLRGDWAGAWEAFKDSVVLQLSLLWQQINLFIGPVISAFSDLPGDIKDAFVSAWASVVGSITDKFVNVKNFVRDRASDVVGFFSKLPGRIWTAFSGAWAGIIGQIQEKFINLKNFVGNRISDVVGFFTGLPGRASAAFLAGWATIIGGIQEKATNLKGFFKEKIDDIVTFFTDLPGRISAISKPLGKAMDVIHDAFKVVNAAVHALVRALEKVVDAFKWIIDNAKKIGGVLGGIGGAIGGVAGKLNPFGDGVGDIQNVVKSGGGGTGPASISPRLYDELAGARRFGLVLTSGYRPGAVTKHGTPSDHGIYPSHAIDVAGSASGMAGFFRWLIGQRDVKQAFYDPLGSIFGGVLSSYREGGHSDHVHVATYDKGGFLSPGWNLAYNGLGRPEPVGAGSMLTLNINGPVYGSKDQLLAMIQNAAAEFKRRNGRNLI